MEMYLDRCLTSLIVGEYDFKTMLSLEVLVVNDGSTDKSSEIAYEYANRFPKTFKVVDKENGNYGSCINVALNLAKGKYIKILDADDYFDSEVFQNYLEILSQVDADVFINDFDRVYASGKIKSSMKYSGLPIDNVFNLSEMNPCYSQIWMHAVAYRTELLHGICYHQTEGISYTDQEWIFLPFAAANSAYYIPGVLYHYLVGRDGQTVSIDSYKKNFWMELDGLKVMIQEWNDAKKNENIVCGKTVDSNYLIERLCHRCDFVYSKVLNGPLLSYVDQLKEVDAFIKENSPELYRDIESICYPDYKSKNYKFRARYVRDLHRYGLKVCKLHLWLVNHYMGLVSRVSRLFGK